MHDYDDGRFLPCECDGEVGCKSKQCTAGHLPEGGTGADELDYADERVDETYFEEIYTGPRGLGL